MWSGNKKKVSRINNIDIYISDKCSPRQFHAISELINIQLRGIRSYSDQDMNYRSIILEPYDVDNSDEYEVVPGMYKYNNKLKKLFILRKKISLQVMESEIIYGFSSTYNLSIHYLYYLCVIYSGKALIHSAAFSLNNKTVLIPAFGGIGKTFIITRMSENKAVKVFGDDLIILDSKNNIYPYTRPMAIYKYHYQKYLKDRLPYKLHYLYPSLLWRILLRLRLEILNKFGNKLFNIDKITHVRGYIPTDIYDILEPQQIANNGEKLDLIIVIKRVTCKSIEINSVDKKGDREALSKYTSAILFHEWAQFHKDILAYCAFSGRSVSKEYSRVEEIIEKSFRETQRVYTINIPVDATDSHIEHALKSIL